MVAAGFNGNKPFFRDNLEIGKHIWLHLSEHGYWLFGYGFEFFVYLHERQNKIYFSGMSHLDGYHHFNPFYPTLKGNWEFAGGIYNGKARQQALYTVNTIPLALPSILIEKKGSKERKKYGDWALCAVWRYLYRYGLYNVGVKNLQTFHPLFIHPEKWYAYFKGNAAIRHEGRRILERYDHDFLGLKKI